ncbi:MAG: hypothetical protein K2M82_06355 [Lachnospiraceae bacterium]|nr:hypothetical protein [Lachnospiraceae bacterium]
MSGILLSAVLCSCSVNSPEPTYPNMELNSEECTAQCGDNSYKIRLTHLMQGTTSITFTQPQNVNGVIYNFSGSGCEITLGDLSLKTSRSYISNYSLPQVLCEILDNAQRENALVCTADNKPQASTLTEAVFSGRSSHFAYQITTDFDSGLIKKIEVPKEKISVTFSNK